MTDAERRLWFHLRRRQINGFRFRRQFPVGPFVVDFACLEAKLAIEVDGSQHLESVSDASRTGWLRQNGFHLLRFWNDDVLMHTDQVLAVIHDALGPADPHPDLPPRAGEGDKRDKP